MSMPQVTCGVHQVGKMGFGLMQLTWTPHPPPEEESFAAMKAAVDNGSTLWSTGTYYAGYDNLKLIGNFFKKASLTLIHKVTLIVKGGNDRKTILPVNTYDYVVEDIAEAKRLLGDKKLDVFSFGRLDPKRSLEEQWRLLKQLVDEGHVPAVGVSEMSAKSCEEMSKIIKPAVLEIEVSLWSYDQDVKDAIEWSRRTQTPIMAYSPLGRGFLTRKFKTPEDIPQGSFQSRAPRFQGDAFYQNLKLVDQLDELSKKKGVSTGELALAWVSGLSDYIIPIPGSSKPDRVKANCGAANITLTEDDMKEINGILSSFEAKGDRYPDAVKHVLML